jgi:hypothetical protein
MSEALLLPTDASARHLAARLAGIEARVRTIVVLRRAEDPDPDDRFRGLYVADAHVDRLLAPGAGGVAPAAPDPQTQAFLAAEEVAADAAETAGADVRLRRLARSFGLEPFDVELLLIALAPDVDARFERLYGYLNDDVSRRRASAALALELCGAGPSDGAARRRLGSSSPLVAGGLLLVEELDRPFLTRSLRVPDRVAAHLLGDDTHDPMVAALTTPCVESDRWDLAALERALGSGVGIIYLVERTGAAGFSASATALRRVGRPTLALDLTRLEAGEDLRTVAAAAHREARLLGAGLVVGPVDAIAEQGPAAVRAFAEGPATVVLIGGRAWDPNWSRGVPLIVEAPTLSADDRGSLWVEAVSGEQFDGLDPVPVIAPFRLTPEQVQRAAVAARINAASHGRRLSSEDLQLGARAQNAAGLERLARRITPQVGWQDLILPDDVIAQLHELAARTRHRDLVLDGWRMGAKAARGRGVTALFAGDSGTGKTLSAEVVAGELGLDLYVIDLSTVVDKYIGETEKNLDRIFSEADRVNGVLLFDEADALFGKRSEVSDARDRYANVEVAYLLQRMEAFDGVAVLTTNLRSNLDEAFTRRLDAIVDFPIPEEDGRFLLWQLHLREELPRTGDIDLDFLAESFQLSGGEIRNIAVTAAYLAADQARPVGMADLIRATEREYRKLGRMCVEAEFGPYYHLIAEEDD